MSAHPIFSNTLRLMAGETMKDDLPCRVSADLARHEADLRDVSFEQFDETNDEHVEAVVGKELAPVIQQLLLTASSIRMTEGSFGADPVKVADCVREDLRNLEEKCREIWRDL
jgi:uncharacterized protein with HEPN domain